MNTTPIYTVILTGGIASGKSAAADCFLKLGIEVVDADKIARQVVEPEEKGWHAIRANFDPDIFQQDGRLDRKKMRTLVFADNTKRKQLESLLHPLIRQQMFQQIQSCQSAYVIVDVPLYTENSEHYHADKILLVDIPEALQISRLMQRDEITDDAAKDIIAAQSSREKRLELADDIIDNTGSMEQLSEQVNKLHANYLRQSQRQSQN